MMPSSHPVATVIVPSYRGRDRLPALIESLASQQSETPPFDVIVVLDGVDDGSVELLTHETRVNIRHIMFPENRGRPAALNAGFAAARGEILIRCDDDLVVPSGFIAAHVNAHRDAALSGEGHPVGVVGPTRDIHDGSAYARAYGVQAAEQAYRFATSRPADERWRLWAADCSITRETWEMIGAYDESYRSYGWEDVDYGYRLHTAGVPIRVVPAAGAEHHGPARTVTQRAQKAFDSGSARALFDRLHPHAPLTPPSPGQGAWGVLVGAVATAVRHDRFRRCVSTIVDRLLPVVPRRVGTKLAAALVEASGVAGHRAATHLRDGAGPAELADGPRVAIAHDYLTQRGGAERLVLSICTAFPQAEIHTLFYEPDQTYPEYRGMRIRTSPLNRVGLFRRDPRLALPLLAPFASRMRIDADVVIASSSGWAHAFPTRGKKLVYCHSPARWLYLPKDYLGTVGLLDPKRVVLAVLSPLLKRWDRRAAMTATGYWANSSVVRERIRRIYGIDAATLFPPFSPAVAEGPQETIPELAGWAGPDGRDGGHFLVVSRLQPYKHVDVVMEAFRDMPHERLLVVGQGPERDRLTAMAPQNVRLVEGLSDAQMRWAYARSRALLAVSHEDFGLTPLEAGAHGKPVVALHAGGYLDTIADGVNGVFIPQATPAAVRAGVQRLLARGPWNPHVIREHVRAFEEDRFLAALRSAVNEVSGAKQ